jgi:hypothetical protein
VASISEKVLRDTKAELVGGLLDEQRKSGQLPEAAPMERFVDDQLAVVVSTHDARLREAEAKRIAAEAAPVTEREETTKGPGEWYGEAEHSPKIPEALAGETVTAFSRPLRNSDLVAPQQSPAEVMLRGMVRRAMTHPDWKRRLEAVLMSTETDSNKLRAYNAILKDCIRLYGDPRKKRAPKIMVGHK